MAMLNNQMVTSTKKLISCSKRRRCSCVFSLTGSALRRGRPRQATQEASTGSGLAVFLYNVLFIIYSYHTVYHISCIMYLESPSICLSSSLSADLHSHLSVYLNLSTLLGSRPLGNQS
jgi:hypothetical protein